MAEFFLYYCFLFFASVDVFMVFFIHLAFQLFNNSYDVWLANMRGSPQAHSHLRYGNESSDFWSFSFHEWGRYDLPAIVDHIRNESSFQQVLLIGHSQVSCSCSCAMLFLMLMLMDVQVYSTCHWLLLVLMARICVLCCSLYFLGL